MADEARITKLKAVVTSYLDNADGVARLTKLKAVVIHYDTSDVELIGSTGIPSGEAFGTPGSIEVPFTIVGSAGIVTAEAFGSGGYLILDQTVTGAA